MSDFTPIAPYTPLEEKLMAQPEWQEGAAYGKPRRGHPEGAVGNHIAHVLENVEKIRSIVSEEDYQRLRIVTILHDTFKFAVDKSKSRTGENHHAMIARRFAEKFVDDEAVLDLIELHDEAYHAWRNEALHHNTERSEHRLENLRLRMGEHLNLFHLFFCCDTSTGDKTQDPLEWFEAKLSLPPHSHAFR